MILAVSSFENIDQVQDHKILDYFGMLSRLLTPRNSSWLKIFGFEFWIEWIFILHLSDNFEPANPIKLAWYSLSNQFARWLTINESTMKVLIPRPKGHLFVLSSLAAVVVANHLEVDIIVSCGSHHHNHNFPIGSIFIKIKGINIRLMSPTKFIPNFCSFCRIHCQSIANKPRISLWGFP